MRPGSTFKLVNSSVMSASWHTCTCSYLRRVPVYLASDQDGHALLRPCRVHHAGPSPGRLDPSLFQLETLAAAAVAAAAADLDQGLRLWQGPGRDPGPRGCPSRDPGRERSAGACPQAPSHPAQLPSAGPPLSQSPHKQSPVVPMSKLDLSLHGKQRRSRNG